MGAYRDNHGKPFLLPSVREAEKRIWERRQDHEYSEIDGICSFRAKSVKLALGSDSEILEEGRFASMQGISGTGSLRIGLDFLKEWYLRRNAKVLIPDPSWPTH